MSDPQDEGEADRQRLGIDGTMGDAQDVSHPFLPSRTGTCRVCGMAPSYWRHHARPGAMR